MTQLANSRLAGFIEYVYCGSIFDMPSGDQGSFGLYLHSRMMMLNFCHSKCFINDSPHSIKSVFGAVYCQHWRSGIGFCYATIALKHDHFRPDLIVDLLPFVQHLLDVFLYFWCEKQNYIRKISIFFCTKDTHLEELVFVVPNVFLVLWHKVLVQVKVVARSWQYFSSWHHRVCELVVIHWNET